MVVRTDDEQWFRDEVFDAIPSQVIVRRWSAVRGLEESRLEGPPIAGTEDPAGALAWIAMRASPTRAVNLFFDLSPHLEDSRTVRALREAVQQARRTFGTVVLVERESRLPPFIDGEAHHWAPPVPTKDELEEAIRSALREARKTRVITHEVTRRTLDAMVRALGGLTRRQAERVVLACVAEDDRLDASDLDRLVALKRNALGELGGVLEFVQAPIALDEIGGLGKLKQWLASRQGGLDAEAADFGLSPPRGVLMLGVQGAGKSLAAKAVASAWGLPLMRLDAGALYDKFIGESERRLRDSLHQAERMAPAVLWIDEIEKGFASAAGTSTDGGVSRRMFGTLLTWMQERRSAVFLAATANDISVLPPELLRKGRFDEIFFIDLPLEETRRAILEIHLRRRRRDPAGLDVAAMSRASEGYSGAEIEAAIEAALLRAYRDGRRDLTSSDVVDALRASPPLSVVMAEPLASLRAWAKSRCVPAE
ncbi:MAG: AAA family ATPase [Phycisphaeraceae bacterium]|nr:AAA family ATPase [Phycisphaeraceae bacterium]